MSDSKGGETKEKKPPPVEAALKLYDGCPVFRDPNKIGYIRTPIGDSLVIQSEEFEIDLKGRFYKAHQGMLTKQDVNTVKGILVARAYAKSSVEDVHIRVAERKRVVYLDLANAGRHVVVASAADWQVSVGVPIPFRRPAGMAALAAPQRGWEGWTLRDYLAYLFPRFGELVLLAIASFLVAAFRPRGPFPLLQFIGPKGGLKTTTARMIKALIDPDSGDERGFPRNEQDFSIHGFNCWVVSFGNISDMPRWMSNALCRLSTGGTFASRKLYTNNEESVISLKRPAIITGISDMIEQSDLKDRILLVELPEVDERDRKTEEEVWARFRELQPFILAALLDCVCAGLANLDAVKPERLHRLADWHKFMIAAFPAMGFEEGLLDQMLEDNRRNAAESVIESSWVAQAVIELMTTRPEHSATPSDMFDHLRNAASNRIHFDPKRWPGDARVLSAELRQLEPDLCQRGIRIGFGRTGRRRIITIRRDADDAGENAASPSASQDK